MARRSNELVGGDPDNEALTQPGEVEVFNKIVTVISLGPTTLVPLVNDYLPPNCLSTLSAALKGGERVKRCQIFKDNRWSAISDQTIIPSAVLDNIMIDC